MSSFRSSTRTAAPFTGPRWWIAAIYLVVALLAQVEVMHYLRFRDAEPSLVLVVVVWYAIRADVRRAALYGLIAGLLEDALAMTTGVGWTVSTVLTAAGASALSQGFFADSIPLVAGIVAVATLLRDAIFWIVRALEGFPAGYGVRHLHQALWQALLDAVVVAIVMALLRLKAARIAQ